MSEPRWHPEAVREVEEARDWYAERSPLAARGFLLELEKPIDTVLAAPNRSPMGKHHCRRLVFPGRYPYTLVYRTAANWIEIVAVAHQKRHPAYWAHR